MKNFLRFAVLTLLIEAPLATAGVARFNVGPTLGLLNSKLGYGVTGGMIFKQDAKAPIGFGFDTGFVRWNESASLGSLSGTDSSGNTISTGNISVSATLTTIPVLATVVFYPMGSAATENTGTTITPYLGLGLGISITSVSATITYGNQSASDGTSFVYFMALVKPGIELGSFFVEPKFGVLKDEFIFLPTVGYSF